MKLHKIFWLGCLATLFVKNAFGEEDFNLFDRNRGKPAPKAQTPPPNPFNRAPPPAPPTIPQPPKPPPVQKDFTLRGTSQIGDRQYAILQSPDGKEFIQKLEGNQRTPLQGYADYALLKVIGREVVIEYPKASPCQTSDPTKGLKCSADQKTAILSLVVLNAIASSSPPPSPMPPPVTTPQPPPEQTEQVNPFMPKQAKPQDEEERKRRSELYKNFKRQVIRDEDVPPGMRVIRTPFGDRLVPDTRQ